MLFTIYICMCCEMATREMRWYYIGLIGLSHTCAFATTTLPLLCQGGGCAGSILLLYLRYRPTILPGMVSPSQCFSMVSPSPSPNISLSHSCAPSIMYSHKARGSDTYLPTTFLFSSPVSSKFSTSTFYLSFHTPIAVVE